VNRFVAVGIIAVLFVLSSAQQKALPPRVQLARDTYDINLEKLLLSKGLSYPCKHLYIRILKFDKTIEVWGSDNGTYALLKTYPIAQLPGSLGPKLREGDLQTPEGFYFMGAMNPYSQYYLSLEIKYPNKADSIRSPYKQMYGGDIYIHGSDVSAGCTPIGDRNIAELYWLCYRFRVHNPGVKIPIHIFPFKMDDANIAFFNKEKFVKTNYWGLWNQLTPMYKNFQATKKLSKYYIDDFGNYNVIAAQ
jgi:murein L,D-transpeptidase YafK